MELVEAILAHFQFVVRCARLDCGLVCEVLTPANATENWKRQTYRQIAEFAWNHSQEVVYSIYFFNTPAERFTLNGILRTTPSTRSFNMSSSTLSAADVFGDFTRYDFDILTLSTRTRDAEIFFTIADSSPSRQPNALFKELDLQGHQFAISSRAVAAEGHYVIVAEPGLDFL